MIRDIEKRDEIFNVGYIDSNIFNKKCEVWIENTVEINYAEKCVECFQSLQDKVIDKICERISAYHKFMLEEWCQEFVVEINQKVPSNVSGREILKYVENPKIFIFPPKGDGFGYVVEGDCEWEPEHGIDIIMLNADVIDVGPAEGLSPWTNAEQFEREY